MLFYKIRLRLGVAVAVVAIFRQKAKLQALILLSRRRVIVEIISKKNLVVVTENMEMNVEHPFGIALRGVALVETHTIHG